MRKFLLIAGLAALLSGCGEKGDFEKVINAKISQSKLCYSLQDNDIVFNKGFPIRVNHGYRSAGYSASDEILKGLVNQGLLDVSQQPNGFSSVDILEVTDRGQEVEFGIAKMVPVLVIGQLLRLKAGLKRVRVMALK